MKRIQNNNLEMIIKNKINLFFSTFQLSNKRYRVYNTILNPNEAKIESIKYENYFDIREYIEILEESLKPSEKKTLYNKLLSLNLQKSKLVCYASNSTGIFNPSQNKITYASKKAIMHELLHMSSSHATNGISYCGFEQELKNYTIGTGLNEGYTELLATRIINKNNKPDSYYELVKLAYLLEFFFENIDDMRKLYFDHDLASFIRHMKKYALEKEIIDFILDMDKIEKYSLFLPITSTIISLKLQNQLQNWLKNTYTTDERKKEFNKILKKNAHFMKVSNSNLR